RQPNGAVSDRVPVLQCAMRLGSIQPRILRKLTGAGSGFWPDIRPLARLLGSHGASGTGERLVHDAPDGPGAASALPAAAEAIVDFAGGARREARADDGAACLLVAEHVTGTNDQGFCCSKGCARVRDFVSNCKRKTQGCSHSNLDRRSDTNAREAPAPNWTTAGRGKISPLHHPKKRRKCPPPSAPTA